MKIKKFIIDYAALLFILIIGVGCLIISSITIWKEPQIWSQGLALSGSVFVGATVTALVTKLLLKSQAEQDQKLQGVKAEKDLMVKNAITIHESKVKVYSDFISKMWATCSRYDDNNDFNAEFNEIKSAMFGQLILYLNDTRIPEISESVKKIRRDPGSVQHQFAEITSILKNDLGIQDTTGKRKAAIDDLWDSWYPVEKENRIDTKEKDEDGTVQFWHFNAQENFPDALHKGKCELSLWEYGEEKWRREMLMQVKIGDIVFAFKSGGIGYYGVFRVVGRRLFIRKGDSIIEQIINGNETKIIEARDRVNADVNVYDFFNALDDGATSVSNLIVQTIATYSKGVQYPGGVYRRTISRYDHNYGRQLLSRFLWASENDKENFNYLICDNEKNKIDVQDGLFDELIKKENIKSASTKDGRWEWTNME